MADLAGGMDTALFYRCICDAVVLHTERESHRAEFHALVPCQGCGMDFPAYTMQLHQMSSCDGCWAPCAAGCGKAVFFQETEAHLNSCPAATAGRQQQLSQVDLLQQQYEQENQAAQQRRIEQQQQYEQQQHEQQQYEQQQNVQQYHQPQYEQQQYGEQQQHQPQYHHQQGHHQQQDDPDVWVKGDTPRQHVDKATEFDKARSRLAEQTAALRVASLEREVEQQQQYGGSSAEQTAALRVASLEREALRPQRQVHVDTEVRKEIAELTQQNATWRKEDNDLSDLSRVTNVPASTPGEVHCITAASIYTAAPKLPSTLPSKLPSIRNSCSSTPVNLASPHSPLCLASLLLPRPLPKMDGYVTVKSPKHGQSLATSQASPARTRARGASLLPAHLQPPPPSSSPPGHFSTFHNGGGGGDGGGGDYQPPEGFLSIEEQIAQMKNDSAGAQPYVVQDTAPPAAVANPNGRARR